MRPRELSTAGELRGSAFLVAPTAAALIAQQVASNAVRDEYLETVLPSGIFAALVPRLSAAPVPFLHKRGTATVGAELLEAAATIRVSRTQLLQELTAPDLDGEG